MTKRNELPVCHGFFRSETLIASDSDWHQGTYFFFGTPFLQISIERQGKKSTWVERKTLLELTKECGIIQGTGSLYSLRVERNFYGTGKDYNSNPNRGPVCTCGLLILNNKDWTLASTVFRMGGKDAVDEYLLQLGFKKRGP